MPNIKIGNAPCSWGIIEGVESAKLTHTRQLNELAEAGYAGTELGDWGFMPTDPIALSAELKQRNLSMIASWVSVKLHEASHLVEDIANCVRTARLLAAVGGPENMIVLGNDPYADAIRTKISGRVTTAHRLPDADFRKLADAANAVASAVKQATGLRTVMHHHISTWVETPAETATFLAETDPTLVGLCFDTGHWTFAGGNPIEGLRKHRERVWHVHFKDCEPNIAAQSRQNEWDGVTSVGKGVFCELGKGTVNFAAIKRELEEMQYTGWVVVEQDVLAGMGTPKESAMRNRAYLKSLGL